MSVDYKAIGQRIKEIRKQQKKTQEQLAERISVTVGYISQVERGVTKVNLDTLSEISAVLDEDIAYFITGTAINTPSYMQDSLNDKFTSLNYTQKQILLELLDVIQRNYE